MTKNNLFVGWKEWAALPMLNIPCIKVKIDTGAKTSTLHAENIEIIKKNGKDIVEFTVHPIQKNHIIYRKSSAEIIDIRAIKSSSGCLEKRILIRSPIQIGSEKWEIDISLTNRNIMNYRMLLGREAMSTFVVSPTKAYCQSVLSTKKLDKIYTQ